MQPQQIMEPGPREMGPFDGERPAGPQPAVDILRGTNGIVRDAYDPRLEYP